MHPHWTDLPNGTTTARGALSPGRQFQIPTTVTTTWRGPLQLRKRSTLTSSLQLGLGKQKERRRIHIDTHTPRPLTRFRVMMRPIDIVEQELEVGVSGADLTNEIHHHLTQVSMHTHMYNHTHTYAHACTHTQSHEHNYCMCFFRVHKESVYCFSSTIIPTHAGMPYTH